MKLTTMQRETAESLVNIYGCTELVTEEFMPTIRLVKMSFNAPVGRGLIFVGPAGKVTGTVNGVKVTSYDELLNAVD